MQRNAEITSPNELTITIPKILRDKEANLNEIFPISSLPLWLQKSSKTKKQSSTKHLVLGLQIFRKSKVKALPIKRLDIPDNTSWLNNGCGDVIW